ncbi:MAG TPA: hypothetical protein VD929_04750 [Caulobacteraceae bacterium]|nr:hypothetical protein [Caulobacteraceae bacterium]
MNDKEKNLQHAMMSFALMGGMLVTPRHRPHRTESRPQDFVPTPRKPR